MDMLGIKVYFEQRYFQFKQWCAKERSPYTNRDLLVDQLQIVVIVALLAQLLR